MPAFKNILFPVDFSDRSKALRPYVKTIVEQFQAKLTVMHVVEVPMETFGGVDRSFPVVFDFPSMKPHVEDLLKEYTLVPGTEIVVQEGDAAVNISDYASEHAIDLIMMPTHGYGKFRSLLMGSVVSKVLHDAESAVWTAVHADDPAMREHLPCRNIVVAVDRGVEQTPVLLRAAELAQELGAGLTLVHAVPGAENQPYDTGGEEFALFLLDAARKDMAKLQAEAGTSYEATVVAGGVGKVVRQAALDRHADLVVIGRGVMHETFGRLRTQSYEIIRRSPCPVLSL
ncbi:MAG TPA: universal stress protein [Bryobacteraceae bacterium]|jgi:nucleotide-binding universal stress UspA family protein